MAKDAKIQDKAKCRVLKTDMASMKDIVQKIFDAGLAHSKECKIKSSKRRMMGAGFKCAKSGC